MERPELTPEERLAADITFLDEELIRCEMEIEELTKCNIPLSTHEADFPFKPRKRRVLSSEEEDRIVENAHAFRKRLDEQEKTRTNPDEYFLNTLLD